LLTFVCPDLSMPIVDITARLEMFEERVKLKSEMDQLRAAFDRLQCLFDARYSQRQVWEDLEKAGLQMGFDGFKTALRRIELEREGVKKDSRKMEGASETSACVHCGGELAGVKNSVDDQEGAKSAAKEQTVAQL